MYIVSASQLVHLISEIRPQTDGRARVTALQSREAVSLRDDRREVCRQLFKVELLLVSQFNDGPVCGRVREEGVCRVQEGLGRAAVLRKRQLRAARMVEGWR